MCYNSVIIEEYKRQRIFNPVKSLIYFNLDEIKTDRIKWAIIQSRKFKQRKGCGKILDLESIPRKKVGRRTGDHLHIRVWDDEKFP
jgi:hypothetical protein